MSKTELKAKQVKELIEQGTELKEIIRLKFGNSTNRKTQWLMVNNRYFTNDELKYLGFIQEMELLDQDLKELFGEEKPQELKKMETLEHVEEGTSKELINNMGYGLEKKDFAEKINFLFDQVNFDKLVAILDREEVPGTRYSVGFECERVKRKFKNAKAVTKNIRIYDKIYNEFTKICQKKDLKVINALNLALSDFIDKYK